MNIYDFDGTIYDGDSTVDFYLYCLRKHPKVLKAVPRQLAGMVKYVLKRIDKTAWKEHFFAFLLYLPDREAILDQFCAEYRKKIAPWYRNQKRDDDVVISASPKFLVERFCRAEAVRNVIASEVNENTGIFLGPNCRGEEKVRRFRECFGNAAVDKFYSDSKSDLPLAALAKESYLIRGSAVKEWEIK